MPKDLESFQNILAYELVRRALLTRAILAFSRGGGGVRGGFVKDQTFYGFFCPLPLLSDIEFVVCISSTWG